LPFQVGSVKSVKRCHHLAITVKSDVSSIVNFTENHRKIYHSNIVTKIFKKNQHPSKLIQRLKFVQKFVSMDYRHIIIVVKVVLVVVWCFLVVVVEEIE